MSNRHVFDYVSKNFVLVTVISILFGTVAIAMNVSAFPLNEFENNVAPDVRFGFNIETLHEIYNEWGQKGCDAYLMVNTLDFIFIQCYVLFLGSVLAMTSRWSGSRTDFSFAIIVTAIADMVESAVLRTTVIAFPLSVDEWIVKIGSLGQQIKWIFLGFSILLILVQGFKGLAQKQKED
mmetsp:Transcript_8770/g.11038  ORF Transcript_8770/g.11038 Transcript_8770/m.11038 type:complete len:179 (-) Transcript_8770:38-574(-)